MRSIFARLLRAVLLLSSLALAGLATAQTTVTLQDGLNGYAGTTDNWIVNNSGANINRGDNVEIAIRDVSDMMGGGFDSIPATRGPLTKAAASTSATLSLYKAYG